MSHSSPQRGLGAEARRLAEDERRSHNWKRWGPYLSERQWGTVREDYSPGGTSWTDFPHEYARSRAYRWGEDGLMGITDRQCRHQTGWTALVVQSLADAHKSLG
jgi:hypothetical protein